MNRTIHVFLYLLIDMTTHYWIYVQNNCTLVKHFDQYTNILHMYSIMCYHVTTKKSCAITLNVFSYQLTMQHIIVGYIC